MNKLAVIFSTILFSSLVSNLAMALEYPLMPEPSMTSGKLCDLPVSYRYPERIAYCDRDVTTETKNLVIAQYDARFGYQILKMNRGEFKIDHFIPLCAGGSNDISNLWPQHRSIYIVTDPVEPLVCELMAEGKLKQAEGVALVIRAKTQLEETPRVLKYLKSLGRR